MAIVYCFMPAHFIIYVICGFITMIILIVLLSAYTIGDVLL